MPENRKIHHGVFSTYKYSREEKQNYVDSEKFTPEDYVKLLTNQYMHPRGRDDKFDLGSFFGISTYINLIDNRHNTPENNQKVLEYYLNRVKKGENEVRGLADIMSLTELPSNTIHDILDNPDKYYVGYRDSVFSPRIESINPDSLTKEHLYKMAEKYPKAVADYLDHPEIDDHFIDKHVLNNKEVMSNISTSDVLKLSERENLTPNQVKSLIYNVPRVGESTTHNLLDKLPENERNEVIDDLLGIKDGRHLNPFDEEELREEGLTDQEIEEQRKYWNEEDNWDVWKTGTAKNNIFAENVASYHNLSDRHAEHIMRHGNHQEKWNLYHNENINPDFAVKMYDKWYHDDDGHGYDQGQFLKKLKEKHRDNLYDEFYDQAREDTERDYPLSEYLRYYGTEHVTNEHLQDYIDDIHDLVHENYSSDEDWVGENPYHDSSIWDNWEKIKKYADTHGLDFVNGKDIQAAGVDPDNVEGYAFDMNEEDDTVSLDDLAEEYKEYAPTIDYRNHDDWGIHEHPEYDDRYAEAVVEFKDKLIAGWGDGTYAIPDEVYEGYDEWTADPRFQREQELIDEHFEKAMDNEDYMPSHVKNNHPKISESINKRRIRKFRESQQKAIDEEKSISEWLGQHIPYRGNAHEYGEGLHHHEILKDYADENNGKIDIGRMHKLHPNLKDTWKQIFDGKGKLTSEEIQQKIDELPKTEYHISYKDWEGKQRTNNNKQVVFRLDHSEDSIKPLQENPELYDTFHKVADVSYRSGHPTNRNTIAWSRVDTSNPKHWFIDEVQSDFGSAARDYLKNQGAHDKADHIQKIINHHKDWRENMMNYIIKEAKKHGVEKISMHSPESKAAHTGAGKVHTVYKDSYKKVPRKMGFVQSPSDDFPLDDAGRKIFGSKGKQKQDVPEQGVQEPNTQEQVKKQKIYDGYTLDLRPKALRKNLEIASLLLKTELAYILGKSKNMEVKHLLKNIVNLRKSLGHDI